MRSHSPRGFTLTELLAVISVIGVLMSLLLPAVNGIRSSARSVQCKNNLREISAAYSNYMSIPNRTFVATNWPAELLPYVEGNQAIYRCVEDTSTTDTTSAGLAYIRIQKLGGYPIHTIPMTAGPNCHHLDLANGSYELDFETGEAIDWDDCKLRIDPQADGGYKVTVLAGDDGMYTEVYYPNGTLAFKVLGYADTAHTMLVTAEEQVSYGMHNRADRIKGSNRIRALEYQTTVANLGGDYPTGIVTWPSDVAPRHQGLCNVLFADGHIDALAPDDMDPNDPVLCRWYWY